MVRGRNGIQMQVKLIQSPGSQQERYTDLCLVSPVRISTQFVEDWLYKELTRRMIFSCYVHVWLLILLSISSGGEGFTVHPVTSQKIAGCPTIQLNFDTIFLEIESDLRG